MSTPIDSIGLPPRALGALRKAKIKTAEVAAAKSDKDLLAIRGFGELGLGVLRAWQKGLGLDSSDEDAGPTLEAELEVRAATQLSHPTSTLSGQRSDLAKFFFEKLAERGSPSTYPTLVRQSWDLALSFEQEGYRAAGGPLLIAEGMAARFNGQNCIVRTSPTDEVKVAAIMLVKAP